MFSYVAFSLLALLCCFIYVTLIKIRFFKVKWMMQNEILKENIILQAIEIEREYSELYESGELNSFPAISNYLFQSSFIVDTGSLSLSKLKVSSIPKQEYYSQKLMEEISKAPDFISQLFFKQFSVLKKMAYLQHPLCVKVNDFKIGTLLFIHGIVIKMLNSMGKGVNDLKEAGWEFELRGYCIVTA